MYGGPVSMSGPDPAAERPRNPRPTPKAQPDREGDLPTPDCCRKAALPAPTCKVQNEGAAPHTGGGAFFHVRWFHLRIRASRRKAPRRGSHQSPATVDERTRAAAHTESPSEPPPPRPEVQEPGCPQSAPTTDRSQTASGLRASPSPFHPKAGGTRGIREAPQKNGRQRPNGIRAWTSPTPFHPKRTENRRLRQRPQTEEKEGRRGRRGRRKEEGGREREKGEGSQKAGKQKSGEAGKRGSREAGKPGSREAGKPGSREAGGGIKKRRRTVGCTSACGSQRSLAYRNYLLR